MCAAAKNYKNIQQNTSFKDLRSLKVVGVDKSKKPVTDTCMQQVCTYFQPFLHYKSQ